MINRVQWRQAVLLLAWLAPLNSLFAADCKDWAGKAVSVQGEIEVQRSHSGDWQAVKRHDIFCPGSQIRSRENSRVAIILSNETLLRLDQNSVIKLKPFEKKQPSILEFFKGIGHFISRIPRSLKVETATVDAAITGTEFVIAASETQTTFTVFEGTVHTQNTIGEQTITNGESVIATAYEAPVKTLLARPRDTVQWALYFPPLINDDTSKTLAKASQLLAVGRVKQAQALLADLGSDEDSGEALALKSIIAIVNNQKETAFQLAGESIKQSPNSAAAYIALSYAWQAKLELNQALASAQKATEVETDNAIAWARLADLQLSTGNLKKALKSAKKATQYNPQLSRTQSILGYAHLLRIDIDKAIETFNKAIELDQVDPLPHLGLGLAKIRKNNLQQGRRQIEIAASLNPNNAIIRSYLGKAYFEEKRTPLDGEQFAMAKELDPNDPTAYFYDAIRKQSENDPVGALEDLNTSIELNNNRAVYRSSLQLDQDEAARSVSLARIYQDLAFQQLAINEATKSLANDPANHSAHRFLADAYASRQRHETAQASELLQAQLLQPLGLTTLQPQFIESDLGTLNYSNSFGSSSSDFTNLYTRNGALAQVNVFGGNNNTKGDEVTVAGLFNKFAISAAQYAYRSDGFRPNNDASHDIYNLFMQARLSNRFSIQAEYLKRETDKGDQSLIFDTSFDGGKRTTIDTHFSRVGFNFKPSVGHTLLGSFINRETKDTDQIKVITTVPFDIIQTTTTNLKRSSNASEIAHIYTESNFNITSGITNTNENENNSSFLQIDIPPAIGTPTPLPTIDDNEDHASVYSYSLFGLTKNTELALGLSYDRYQAIEYKIERLNPKIGVNLHLDNNILVRLASFKLIKRPLVSGQTLEPTQFAAFNQFYEDLNGTKITQYNLGFEIKESDKLHFGFNSYYREINAPTLIIGDVFFDEIEESNHHLYLNWSINNHFSLSLDSYYEDFKNDDILIPSLPLELTTKIIPVSLLFTTSAGFNTRIIPTYVNQDYIDSSNSSFHDSFWVTDLALEYKFSNRRGSLSLGAHNIFDRKFNFHNLNYTGENNEPQFIPDASVLVQLNLTFY